MARSGYCPICEVELVGDNSPCGRCARKLGAKAEPRAIVIAWITTETEWDGKPYARDLGARPGMVEIRAPHAAMWLGRGFEADVEKARAHVEREYGAAGMVLTYPTSEHDPLGRARAVILARFRAEARTIDMGNNETRSIGVFESDGGFMALTLAASKGFKTRKGAEKWLARRGYGPNGETLPRD